MKLSLRTSLKGENGALLVKFEPSACIRVSIKISASHSDGVEPEFALMCY